MCSFSPELATTSSTTAVRTLWLLGQTSNQRPSGLPRLSRTQKQIWHCCRRLTAVRAEPLTTTSWPCCWALFLHRCEATLRPIIGNRSSCHIQRSSARPEQSSRSFRDTASEKRDVIDSLALPGIRSSAISTLSVPFSSSNYLSPTVNVSPC